MSRVRTLLALAGIDIETFRVSLRALPRFIEDAMSYKRRSSASSLPLRVNKLMPCMGDYTQPAGMASGDYFHQDLWAARKVERRRPAHHVDIGSRIDGFVAHVLVFMKVTVVDVRPLEVGDLDLSFLRCDATSLNQFADDSLESVSSLNAAEHFGLGRYSDEIDPMGHLKFMASLQRVLAPGGRLYFSVPVGGECLYFNSHRVLRPQSIVDAFSKLKLVSFSYVDDAGLMWSDVPIGRVPADAKDSCGLFEFTKE